MRVFKYQVTQLAKQKDTSLFHCYCHRNIFRITTAKKVMDFDFTYFKSEEKIIHFMLIAIGVLKKHLDQQKLLFDDPEEVLEKES
ncbi:MAG: hypothetical protein ABIO56_16020 [Ferruginibacter sp.]